MYDWIIAGAGFTGATVAERIATQLGQRVLVVDRRSHIGGNAYDQYDVAGVLSHAYGPHIFHTNSDRVWAYLQQFSDWTPYFHRVRAIIDGREAPIPFNLDTIEAVFPAGLAGKYIDALLAQYRFGERVPILKLMERSEPLLRDLGAYVYEKVFRNYTQKQWGFGPEELSPAVTARVPILVSRDDRYFQDRYQAMPTRGYTPLIANMLRHEKISLMLQTSFEDVRNAFPNARVLYTGPIDEYFGCKFGRLPYRSLDLRWRTLDKERAQSTPVINYPEEFAFTRITEMKQLTGQVSPKTSLVAEHPCAYEPGRNEPYYPIPREETRALYALYEDEARRTEGVIFAGRLGSYQYLNMDQAVGAALAVFEKKIRMDGASD